MDELSTPSGAPAPRLTSIDCLRGLAMVVMALDHVRVFTSEARFAPVDLAHTTPALFFTRWATHFCAPTFFLLAGTGAFLSLGRGKTRAEVSRFFATRGLWLVVLELTVVALGWHFTPRLQPWTAGVIWALGWSMVLMAALAWLPIRVIGAMGVALIAFHNATDALTPEAFGSFAWLWRVLHVPDPQLGSVLRVDYPLVPWVGVMAVGYSLGALMRQPPERRRRVLVGTGLAALAAFLVLRFANGYGDPIPWSTQRTPLITALSFLRVRKYPPSLDFLLMTLGPILIALSGLERVRGRVADFLITFGRVPLLFYVLHLYLAHAVAVVIAYAQGGTAAFLFANTGVATTHYPVWYGLGLAGVYAAWVMVVAALFPVCRAFAEVKARRRDWWLGYL